MTQLTKKGSPGETPGLNLFTQYLIHLGINYRVTWSSMNAFYASTNEDLQNLPTDRFSATLPATFKTPPINGYILRLSYADMSNPKVTQKFFLNEKNTR